MEQNVVDRLTLVTVFLGKEVLRSVSAYADVQARVPGLSYESPMALMDEMLSDQTAYIVIKPLSQATPEEVASI